MMNRKVVIISIILGLFLPAVAIAASCWEQEVTNVYTIGMGKKITEASQQRVTISNQKLRLEDITTGKVTIIRLDKSCRYQLDEKAQTYTQTDFKALTLQHKQEAIRLTQSTPQRARGMEAVRQKMLKSMDGMSDMQQTIMEQQMQARQSMLTGRKASEDDANAKEDTNKITIKEATEIQTVNNYPCKRVKLLKGPKKKVIDLWVTTKAGPQNFLSEFLEWYGFFSSNVLTELKKVNGFPIKYKYKIQLGPLKDVVQGVEVTKLETKDVAEDFFEVPATFKKVLVEKKETPIETEEESF